MLAIESVYEHYRSEQKAYRKNAALQQAFICYEPWANMLSYDYARKFPSTEPDDWRILVQLGIWEGLERCAVTSEVRKHIFYRVKHQIAKEVQLLIAAKQSLHYENLTEDFSTILPQTVAEEVRWITKVDIESALECLPTKSKTILKMWMEGYTVLEICSVVGLKDAAVYNHINASYDRMRLKLEAYEWGIA